jgi:Zn-dependent protease
VLRPYTVARLRGVPIRVAPSLGVTCWAIGATAARLAPSTLAAHLPAVAILIALIAAVIFAGSVLLHELAHLAALLHYDVPVEHVMLSAWGGVTRAAHRPDTPRADFAVAAAGPACTLLLGLAGAVLACALGRAGAVLPCAACVLLAATNLVTALPSLAPAWPADGGYMLRAVAWKLSGSPSLATRFACYQSMALIGALLLTGAVSFVHPFLPGGGAAGATLIVSALVLSPNVRGVVATLRRT